MLVKIHGDINSSIKSILIDNTEVLISEQEEISINEFIKSLKKIKDSQVFAINVDFKKAIIVNYENDIDDDDWVELIPIEYQEDKFKNEILNFIDLIENKNKE